MQRLTFYRSRAQMSAFVLLLAVCAVTSPAEDFSLGPETSSDQLITDQLIRMTRQTLGNEQQPRPDQLTRARVLLDLALEISPEDAELLRLCAELSQRMGDEPTYRRTLARYCQLRPTDDAAHLDLILASVSSRQTLPQRAQAVRGLLEGEEAEKFTAALRSRLASYLARTAYEAGDNDQALAWIKRAVALDQSNKEAARLAMEVVDASKTPSKLAIGTALLLVIRADPLDPKPRLDLAQLLLEQGAYAEAAEQYDVAEKLGSAPDARMIRDWALALAAAGQTDRAVALLDTVASWSADAKLPLGLELLRLAVLHKAGDEPASEALAKLIEQLEQLGGPDQRIKLLHEVYARGPGTIAAMLAVLDLAQQGIQVQPLADGAKLVASLKRWRNMVRRPDPADRPWCLLQIEIEPVKRFAYLQPITATARLRNATDMPLALGPEQTIPSAMLVLTPARIGGEPIDAPSTIVVDMRRRLRIEPRKAIELPVRLDRGELGDVLAQRPGERFSFSATALLDPMLTADGALTAGPRGAADTERLIERRGLRPTEANITGWLEDIESAKPSTATLTTMARLVRLAADVDDPQLKARIVEKVDKLLPTLDRFSQALLICLAPPDAESQALWPKLHAHAAASDDTLVRICYLARHVAEPDSTHIQTAIDGGDVVVARFAKALRDALQQPPHE